MNGLYSSKDQHGAENDNNDNGNPNEGSAYPNNDI